MGALRLSSLMLKKVMTPKVCKTVLVTKFGSWGLKRQDVYLVADSRWKNRRQGISILPCCLTPPTTLLAEAVAYKLGQGLSRQPRVQLQKWLSITLCSSICVR